MFRTKLAFITLALATAVAPAAVDFAAAAVRTSPETADDNKTKKGDKKGKKDDKKDEGRNQGAKTAGAAAHADCTITRSSARLAGLSEASGVAVSRRTPGILWSHGDTNPTPTLHAFDTNGAAKGRVRLDAKVTDSEDIAASSCGSSNCLYLADIGDNTGRRANIAVLRFPEPAPGDATVGGVESFAATFPDGAQDAEAFFVTPSGEVFIVTKGETSGSSVYRFPSLKSGSTVVLQKVGTLHEGVVSRGEWITGASASPDGRWIALRTHGAVRFYEASRFVKGDFTTPLTFDTGSLKEPQGEGVALGAGGALYLTGEGGRKGSPGTLASGVCKLP